jgi:cell wall-associated NlpC family hydrolase
VTSAVAAGAVLGGVVLSSQAQAATPTYGAKAIKVAAAKKGAPYRWGAVGPTRFDCSGLTLYSFKKVGKSLPRTAQQQYNKVRHISASQRQVGDLVFFHSGSHVYHVGIYAGAGKIWHAPHTGAVVRLERIWTKSVWYGRA